MVEKKACPLCGNEFDQNLSAISRFDNKTEICSKCGKREALHPFTEKELSDQCKRLLCKNKFVNDYMLAVMMRNIRIQYGTH
jgi:hypothetical protein